MADLASTRPLHAPGARPRRRSVTLLVEEPLAEASFWRQGVGGVAFLDLAPDGKTVAVKYIEEAYTEQLVLKSKFLAKIPKKIHASVESRTGGQADQLESSSSNQHVSGSATVQKICRSGLMMPVRELNPFPCRDCVLMHSVILQLRSSKTPDL